MCPVCTSRKVLKRHSHYTEHTTNTNHSSPKRHKTMSSMHGNQTSTNGTENVTLNYHPRKKQRSERSVKDPPRNESIKISSYRNTKTT
eukprot:UN19777